MLVRYYLELDQPAYAVEAVLGQDPQAWLPDIAGDSNQRGLDIVRVGLNIGPYRLDREVSLVASSPRWIGDTWVIPIAWSPTRATALLPSLEGDLEVSGLAGDRAQLAISASYRAPLGWLGVLTDQALMRRVGEATVKDFLDHVATRVEASLRDDAAVTDPEGPSLLATSGPAPGPGSA